MRPNRLTQNGILALLLASGGIANAVTFDLATATDLFVPSFRGEANTTYLGWDQFGKPGDTVINDTEPDVGTDSGSFVTTNGEDHQSGSLNYYSGGGTVAENVSFATAGTNGSGFTTVIVQGKTLFGGFGAELALGPINGVEPVQVLQATNAAGAGQLFAKYELPGTADVQSFDLTQTAPGGPTSLGLFVVDTAWSPSGFAADAAIATPEPTTALLAMLAMAGMACSARR